ncbi:hypothetical protein FRC01_013410, partial [Tulasnella sp. 417]
IPNQYPVPPTISGDMAYPLVTVPVQQYIAQLTPQYAYRPQYISVPVAAVQPSQVMTSMPDHQYARGTNPEGATRPKTTKSANSNRKNLTPANAPAQAPPPPTTQLAPPGLPRQRVDRCHR